MSTITKTIAVPVRPDQAWDAIRDIGALHRRLVPCFVIATEVETDDEVSVRVVTFGNGMIAREPILSCDDDAMRLAWTVEEGRTSHYNGSLQVFAQDNGGSRIVWIVDFFPASIAPMIETAMTAGAASMRKTLGALAESPA